MPMFIFPQPGGSPLLSLLVGLAAIAIVIGLIIFFLPLIAGIFLAAVVLIGAVILWGWIKRKFGWKALMNGVSARLWRQHNALPENNSAAG